jgi:hypothetical protein
MNQTNITAAPLYACCLLAAVLPPVDAQDNVSAREGNIRPIKPELRVSYQSYYTGEIEAVIKAAVEAGRVKEYSRARAADDAFVKGHKGGEHPLKPQQKAAVEKGETDALVFGKWWCWNDGKGEHSAMNLAAGWGVESNPEFRLLWQTHWALLMSDEKKKQQFFTPDVLKARYDKAHKLLEAKVDLINKQHGRRVVNIIPVANAVLKLRAMVAEGKFPGISKQSELFITEKWSGHRHVRMLTAYCNFAAIFGISPEGLSPSVDHLKYRAKGGPDHSMAGITAEQHAILQQLAWDVVSNYPHAGIVKMPEGESGGLR